MMNLNNQYKNMKYLAIILVLVTFAVGAQNQGQYSITGNIIDPNNNPVPYANAALYNQSDSKLITGAVSDDKGQFVLNVNPGNYFLKITFLSYEEKIIKDLVVAGQDLDLKTITLKPAAELLKEVVVTGEKSQMELQLDKRVFNVGKDLSNISSNAAEILDNVPSVTVDVEGNVSLRGSENVRILIDGRPSGLTGISNPDALRQLQGDMIESIEVITNPSSRYDAEGEVGIINIILKKNVKGGVNGSFSVNAGYPTNYGASFNVNYKKNKINLFSSYSFNYRETPGRGSSFNKYFTPDTTFTRRETSTRTRGGISNNIRVGLDYYLNESNTITGSVLYRISRGKNGSDYDYFNYDANDQLISSSYRNESEREPEQNIELALNYRKQFKEKDRTFTVDVKVMDNVEDEIAEYQETDAITGIQNQRSNNTEDERNLLFQSDYIHPLGPNGKFETGIKATSRLLNNKYMVEELNEANWELLDTLKDHLVYSENIYAGYLMWGNKFGKFSIQAGLRAEYSDILTESKEDGYQNPRKYFNIFPSTHFSYEIDKNKSVQLSYSYRISRPRFRELLPFSGFGNSRSLFIGNPNLNPEYTHSFEMGYLLKWASGSVLPSIYYRYRTGVVERITVPDPERDMIMPVNLSTQNAYGIEFNLTNNLKNWWRLNSNFNFYRAITEGSYNESRLYSDTYTFSGRLTSKMTFFKKYDFQAGVNYRAPQETTQGRSLSLYSIDLGLSRDVLKGNGTITMSVRDLTNSRVWRNVVDKQEGFYSSSEFQWSSRQFMLTFNYRLNQKKDSKGRNSESEVGMEGDND